MISKMGLSVQALALLGAILFSNIGFTHQQVIQVGLQNATFRVGDRAGYLSVIVDLSVTEAGRWYKYGNLLSTISRKLLLLSNGGARQLVVYNVQLSDAGLYTYNIGGESTSAYLNVFTVSNQVNGDWSPWSEWVNNCPATCNTTVIGTKTRSRTCDNPLPQNGGQQCPGPQQDSQQVQCGQANCRIDGLWSDWGNWGEVRCSQTCGTSIMGTRERQRQCTNPPPQNGGSQCLGSQTETESASCTLLPSCSVIVTGLQDTTKPAGDQVFFTVILDQGGLTGMWYKDGVQLSSSGRIQIAGIDTNPYLVITSLVPADSGRYNFTVGGDTTSAYLTVTGQGPINGGWSNWGNWGDVRCSQTCGTSAMGTRERYRTCTNPSPQNGGSQCLGSQTETESTSCTSLPSCSVFVTGLQDSTTPAGGQAVFSVVLNQGGLTGMWYKDGVQLSSSGRIQISRSDTNPVLYITGLVPADSGRYNFTVGGDTTSAYLTVTGQRPINGGWSNWGNWGEVRCSQTCGTSAMGTRERYRTCTNPSPQNGGSQCLGSQTETESTSCTSLPSCSVFVTGLQDSTTPAGGQAVFSVVLNQGGLNGMWYKDGVQLSSSGRIQISRSDTNPVLYITGLVPADSGRYNFTVGGDTTSAYLTVTGQRPINGGWSNWGNWGEVRCSQTCGTSAMGTRERYRTCTNPSPQNGGSQCLGSQTETESTSCTSLPSCSVFVTGLQDTTKPAGGQAVFSVVLNQGGLNGIWSKDGVQLSSSGRTQITRSDTNPVLYITGLVPADSGRYDFTVGGETTSSYLTVTGQGPINGGWSEWSFWSSLDCSQTCGTSFPGVKNRNRSCTNPRPQNDGADCQGSSTQYMTDSCVRPRCPIDGGWTEWSQWGNRVCPQICGSSVTGNRTRSRYCNNPPPQFDGSKCLGPQTNTEQVDCGTSACKVDGGYSQWSNWNDPQCHVTCGENARKTVERTRTCNNPPPSNGGLMCRGPPAETQTRNCRIQGCQVHGNVTQWTEWTNHTCSATCGAQATRSVYRSRTCTNPKPENGGRICTSHLFESLMQGCGLADCEGDKESAFQWSSDYWYIGAIGAAIAIGVVLIILIVVCCVCHCRKDRKHQSQSDRVSSCEMDVLPPNKDDYITRGTYFTQNLNRSADVVKN